MKKKPPIVNEVKKIVREGRSRMLYDMPLSPRHVFQTNPVLRSIDAYKNLTSRVMCAVIMAADFYSPIRMYCVRNDKMSELREMAAWAGGNTSAGSTGLNKDGRDIRDGVHKGFDAAYEFYVNMQGVDALETLEIAAKHIGDIVRTKPTDEKAKLQYLSTVNKALKDKIFSSLELERKTITDLIMTEAERKEDSDDTNGVEKQDDSPVPAFDPNK